MTVLTLRGLLDDAERAIAGGESSGRWERKGRGRPGRARPRAQSGKKARVRLFTVASTGAKGQVVEPPSYLAVFAMLVAMTDEAVPAAEARRRIEERKAAGSRRVAGRANGSPAVGRAPSHRACTRGTRPEFRGFVDRVFGREPGGRLDRGRGARRPARRAPEARRVGGLRLAREAARCPLSRERRRPVAARAARSARSVGAGPRSAGAGDEKRRGRPRRKGLFAGGSDARLEDRVSELERRRGGRPSPSDAPRSPGQAHHHRAPGKGRRAEVSTSATRPSSAARSSPRRRSEDRIVPDSVSSRSSSGIHACETRKARR